MARKFWDVGTFDKDAVSKLASECGYDKFSVFLLCSRGICEKEGIREFLEGDCKFSDPFFLKDMDKAVGRISKAINEGEKIAVWGDYDADGVTATALLYSYLEAMGAYVSYYIPKRQEEGYGLHLESLDALLDSGVTLIITVDNGINSVKEAEYIKNRGADLIITDHHRPGNVLPDAIAVINPKREDDESLFKDLAGVGVAFKLAAALEGGDFENVLSDFSDILALGTIADIVPLKGENRSIAIQGAKALNNTSRPGLVSLKNILGKFGDLTSTDIAFALAPRINAAGRMGSADDALKLLLTQDEEEAIELSYKLHEYNSLRQDAETKITKEAIELIESDCKLKYSRVLVVAGENWQEGVIGIVASRLVDKYGKPAMVISLSESGESKGSSRSIEGFSLFDALLNCSGSLIKFGGHTQAAGFTIENSKIDEFREKVNLYAETLPNFYPVLHLDCRLNPACVNIQLVESVNALEPFGAYNPKPVFGIYNCVLKSIKPIGRDGKHLKITFDKDGNSYIGVYFGMDKENFPYVEGDKINLAASVEKSEFKGEIKASIYIKDIKLSAFDDKSYFLSENLYCKFKLGEEITEKEREFLRPTREFCGLIYNFLKKRQGKSNPAEYISVKLEMGSARTCKVKIVLDAFSELGLIKSDGDIIYLPENAKKTNLEDSSILKSLGYKNKTR